jgi:hypothetical protein
LSKRSNQFEAHSANLANGCHPGPAKREPESKKGRRFNVTIPDKAPPFRDDGAIPCAAKAAQRNRPTRRGGKKKLFIYLLMAVLQNKTNLNPAYTLHPRQSGGVC